MQGLAVGADRREPHRAALVRDLVRLEEPWRRGEPRCGTPACVGDRERDDLDPVAVLGDVPRQLGAAVHPGGEHEPDPAPSTT